MGGGIFGAKGNPESNQNLERISTDYFNMAKPLLEQSQGQVGQILDRGPQQFSSLTNSFQDALRSGATTAYTPAINRSTEAAARAGSQAQQQTREDLTRQGITGSDYDRLLSNALQQQFFNTSQAPAQFYGQQAGAASQYGYGQAAANQGFYRDILGSFYKALSGAPQVGISGLGTAAGNETQINAVNTKAATDMIVGLANASATASKGGAAGCWIAARLYGRYSPEFYYARAWIFTHWQGHIALLTRQLYYRYGQQISRHVWMVKLLKPFIDWSIRRGRSVIYGR